MNRSSFVPSDEADQHFIFDADDTDWLCDYVVPDDLSCGSLRAPVNTPITPIEDPLGSQHSTPASSVNEQTTLEVPVAMEATLAPKKKAPERKVAFKEEPEYLPPPGPPPTYPKLCEAKPQACNFTPVVCHKKPVPLRLDLTKGKIYQRRFPPFYLNGSSANTSLRSLSNPGESFPAFYQPAPENPAPAYTWQYDEGKSVEQMIQQDLNYFKRLNESLGPNAAAPQASFAQTYIDLDNSMYNTLQPAPSTNDDFPLDPELANLTRGVLEDIKEEEVEPSFPKPAVVQPEPIRPVTVKVEPSSPVRAGGTLPTTRKRSYEDEPQAVVPSSLFAQPTGAYDPRTYPGIPMFTDFERPVKKYRMSGE